MASTKSKRARKRRTGSADAPRSTAPRAVASTRREDRERRAAREREERRRGSRALGREGERPKGLFGGVPVSEVAILGGMVAALVGYFSRDGLAIVVGLVVCALGVVEVTGREHFTGYRSHSALLAAVPAIGLEAGVVVVFGDPGQRAWLFLIVVPVFAALFFALRQRFQIARRARVARAARGTAPPLG